MVSGTARPSRVRVAARPRLAARLLWSPAMLLFLLGCVDPPQPLPAEVAAQSVDRAALPPLYQELYDYAFLPEVQSREQRVRLLIWLRHLRFDRYQLGLLQELQGRFDRERQELETSQRALVETHEPKVGAVYDELWAALNRGAGEEELARIGAGLEAVRLREGDLLDLRARSVRALLEAEQPFLQTLRPEQEALFTDAIFLLRHRLDPYANPGDFKSLVGTIYQAGDFGTLTRPTFDPGADHLDIGGLWSEEPQDRAGAHFPNARREVILYMVLLEPTLPEAITAALTLRSAEGEGSEGAAGGAPGGEGGGVPGGGPVGAPAGAVGDGGAPAGGAGAPGAAGDGAAGSPG